MSHRLMLLQVKEDSYSAFEDVWKSRESHLKEMPGFIRFAILKCGLGIAAMGYGSRQIVDTVPVECSGVRQKEDPYLSPLTPP